MSFPRLTEDPCPKALANDIRSIGDIFVQHNDDFAGPLNHAGERRSNPMRLRASDYANGEGKPIHDFCFQTTESQ